MCGVRLSSRQWTCSACTSSLPSAFQNFQGSAAFPAGADSRPSSGTIAFCSLKEPCLYLKKMYIFNLKGEITEREKGVRSGRDLAFTSKRGGCGEGLSPEDRLCPTVASPTVAGTEPGQSTVLVCGGQTVFAPFDWPQLPAGCSSTMPSSACQGRGGEGGCPGAGDGP